MLLLLKQNFADVLCGRELSQFVALLDAPPIVANDVALILNIKTE